MSQVGFCPQQEGPGVGEGWGRGQGQRGPGLLSGQGGEGGGRGTEAQGSEALTRDTAAEPTQPLWPLPGSSLQPVAVPGSVPWQG